MRFRLSGRLDIIFDTGGHTGYERYFKNEYLRIGASTSRSSDASTIIVKIVDQLPSKEVGEIRHSVRCKKLFTFHYLICGIDSQEVRVYFKRHVVDKLYINAIAVFLQAQVLEPIMYLKLLQTNVLLMHAAGVCDEKRGYLFPAHGGTGKTTFSIALLSRGYKLLGDDLLLVDVDEKKVYPYARPLHLFSYNVGNLQGSSVPLRFKFAIYTKNVLRFFLERILRTEFLISTRVHADEIFDHDPFGEPVPYAGIYFLVKSGPPTAVKEVGQANSIELARTVMASADLNASLYSLLATRVEVDRVMLLEEKLIQRLLEQLRTVTFVNTRKLDLSNLEEFVKNHLSNQMVPVQ